MATASNSVSRTRRGCQNCRLRHQKCDDERPNCTRCTKSGIECVRGYNIRFRHTTNPSVSGSKGSTSGQCEFDFAKNQTWMSTRRNLSFIDETQELVSIYENVAQPEEFSRTPSAWSGDVVAPTGAAQTPSGWSGDVRAPGSSHSGQANPMESPRNSFASRKDSGDLPSLASMQSPLKKRRLTYESSHDSPTASGLPFFQSPVFPASSAALQDALATSPPDYLSQISTLPNLTRLDSTDTLTRIDSTDTLTRIDSINSTARIDSIGSRGDVDAAFVALTPTFSRIYLDEPIWPLQSPEEAKLMRFFVEEIASSFDLTDPIRHFASVVPQRAAACPILLNAVYAASARHLSRVSNYNPFVSDRYHQQCLSHLIPMLDDTAAVLDENLLASTVILRYLEEIEVPMSGQPYYGDNSSHLIGTHVFISAQERAAVTGGLRQAAFWVGVRQEVYFAFVNQRSIIPTLEHCNVDRSLDPAEDHVWANRSVVHCAEVLRYCFGDFESTLERYNELLDYCTEWFSRKPASYIPVYYKPHDEQTAFPEVWYLSDIIVTGLQHYYISRILLSSHNPKIPRLGPSRASGLRSMDEEIRQYLRMLGGLALSNSKTPPNFVTASMALAMAGDKFTTRLEQNAALKVLQICENEHAWPTTSAQNNLKEAWGWHVR